MTLILLNFLFFLVNGCVDPEPGGTILHEVNRSHISWAKEIHHLRYSYDGVGMYAGPIQYDIMCLELDKTPSISEARILIVQVTQDLIKRINTNKPLRKFLNNYPASNYNVHYSIFFDSFLPHGSEIPIVTHVSVRNGMIAYDWEPLSAEGETSKEWVELHRESYQDALHQVRQSEGLESN